MTTMVALAADWLLTWLVHASLASAVALMIGRSISASSLRDALWKIALVVPLVTSLISAGVRGPGRPAVDVPAIARRFMPRSARETSVSVSATRTSGPQTISVRDGAATMLRYAVFSVILIPALIATTRSMRRRHRHLRGLRTRRPTTPQQIGVDPSLLVLNGTPVRLSVSPSLESAAAIGPAEVCVSEAFGALPHDERACVIAHEMAHVHRGDVRWARFADAIGCLLAAQPLVGKIVSNFRRDAEFICDEAAVRRIGDAKTYVRTLIFFATSLDEAAGAPAYASSTVVERAERILRSGAVQPREKEWVAALVAVSLLGALLALPEFRLGTDVAVRTQVSTIAATGARQEVHVVLTGR